MLGSKKNTQQENIHTPMESGPATKFTMAYHLKSFEQNIVIIHLCKEVYPQCASLTRGITLPQN